MVADAVMHAITALVTAVPWPPLQDHAELMQEIETFRADPLQPKCDDW